MVYRKELKSPINITLEKSLGAPILFTHTVYYLDG